MKTKWILLCLSLLVTGMVMGQSRKAQKEVERIAYFTEKLDLTETEAEKFWPVYRAQKMELMALRKKRKADIPKKKLEEMSDVEVEKLLDAVLNYKQAELDIKLKYHAKFKSILPIHKVAKLYKAEKDFKRNLIQNRPNRSGPIQQKRP